MLSTIRETPLAEENEKKNHERRPLNAKEEKNDEIEKEGRRSKLET